MEQPTQERTEWVSWPKADENRWVRWRIRERRAIEAGRVTACPWNISGEFELRDYQTWLLRQQEGPTGLTADEISDLFPSPVAAIQPNALPLSYQKIGDMLFAEVGDPDNRKKRAADAYKRVEWEFHRGGPSSEAESRRGWGIACLACLALGAKGPPRVSRLGRLLMWS